MHLSTSSVSKGAEWDYTHTHIGAPAARLLGAEHARDANRSRLPDKPDTARSVKGRRREWQTGRAAFSPSPTPHRADLPLGRGILTTPASERPFPPSTRLRASRHSPVHARRQGRGSPAEPSRAARRSPTMPRGRRPPGAASRPRPPVTQRQQLRRVGRSVSRHGDAGRGPASGGDRRRL